jgi:hypothetical protein
MVAAGVCGEVLVADTEDGELETEVRSKGRTWVWW